MVGKGESKPGVGLPDIGSQLRGIAAYVARLPRGDQAQLRRLGASPGRVPPEVFWRIVQRYEIPASDESFWTSVLPLMVIHQHKAPLRPGVSLRHAGVTAQRVEKFLRLDRDAARIEARRLFSKVKSGMNWVSLGSLLFFWTEKSRLQFAREFFLASAVKKSPEDTPDHIEEQ